MERPMVGRRVCRRFSEIGFRSLFRGEKSRTSGGGSYYSLALTCLGGYRTLIKSEFNIFYPWHKNSTHVFFVFQHFSVFVFKNQNKNQKSWIENSPGKLHLFTTAISPPDMWFEKTALALPKLLFGLAISLGSQKIGPVQVPTQKNEGCTRKKAPFAKLQRKHMASSKQQFSGGYGICFEKSGGKKSLKINRDLLDPPRKPSIRVVFF